MFLMLYMVNSLGSARLEILWSLLADYGSSLLDKHLQQLSSARLENFRLMPIPNSRP